MAQNTPRKPRIVFSTGAGVSAESGITTFRDAGGLWEQYPVMQVASAEGFAADPELVHRFYNERRRQLVTCSPNDAHRLIADLEKDFDVRVITQNVDDLHERAGSSNVLHLHGELMKIRSIPHPDYVETLTPPTSGQQVPASSVDKPAANPDGTVPAGVLDTSPATRGRNGDPMRPHIVFFNEAVPNITPAMELAQSADIFVVIGTSLNVYPAAGLISCVRPGTPIYYIDPNPARTPAGLNVTVLPTTATAGMADLAGRLRGQ